jgi:hypothetical protein
MREMKLAQISYQEADCEALRIAHTVGNVFRHMSYFEEVGGIHFETVQDDSGLGDAIVAIFRFPAGDLAALGTRPTTVNRGVELLCISPETEAAVLRSFRMAFPDIADSEIDTPKA